MNRFKGMLLGVAFMALPAMAQAQAQTINFDDALSSPLPNGYAGFYWDNFYVYDILTAAWTSGYVNGVVSPNYVAYNGGGAPASFSSANPFTFNGGYFTAAWNDGLQLNIIGHVHNSVQTFITTLTLNTSGPTWFTFNWANIDAIEFRSSGGVEHGYGGTGTHFAMDDIQVDMNVVPEPASILLLGTGLAGIAGVIRRRRQKSTEN